MSGELTKEQIEEYAEWLSKEPKSARGFTGRLICDMAIAHLADREDARRYRWWQENIQWLIDDGDGLVGLAFLCQINVANEKYTSAQLMDMIADRSAAIDAARKSSEGRDG